MKLSIVIFLYVFALTSCGSKKSNKNDLNIQEKVEVKKEIKHQQFPGTRIYIIAPQGYTAVPSLTRFQKNTNNYIQAVEIPKLRFKEKKEKIKQSFELAKSKGLKIYYQKEFKLGNYDALLVYGADDKPNIDQMVLVFGDNDFVTMVIGKLSGDDSIAKKEVLSALLTSYIDKSAIPDYSAFTNFTLDLSKTEFKFHSNLSQAFLYTINGQGDPLNYEFENKIMIFSLPSMRSFNEVKAYAQSITERNKNSGIDIPDYEEKEIKINNTRAHETTYTGNVKGRSVKCYQIVLNDKKATIYFYGMAYDRQDELFKQFKIISKTLKTK